MATYVIDGLTVSYAHNDFSLEAVTARSNAFLDTLQEVPVYASRAINEIGTVGSGWRGLHPAGRT